MSQVAHSTAKGFGLGGGALLLPPCCLHLVESVTPQPEAGAPGIFYGISTSAKTPLEQLGAYLVAGHLGASVVTFVAGRFAVLNCKTAGEVPARWRLKEGEEAARIALLKDIYANLRLDGFILSTSDILKDPEYWRGAEEVLRQFNPEQIQGRLGECSALPMGEWLTALGDVGIPFPASLYSSRIPAALYYHPLEVAEVVYGKRRLGCGWKAGAVDAEALYDREIYTQAGVGIIHLRQPLSFDKPGRPQRASAYLVKSSESKRLLFDDSAEAVEAKLAVPGNPSTAEAARLWAAYSDLAGLDMDDVQLADAVKRLQALGRRMEA